MSSTFLLNDKVCDLVFRIETTAALPAASKNRNYDSDVTLNISSGVSNDSQVQGNPPKIEIPKFHSKPTEWQSFWNQFSATVNSKTNIPNVKFSYLKRALTKIF